MSRRITRRRQLVALVAAAAVIGHAVPCEGRGFGGGHGGGGGGFHGGGMGGGFGGGGGMPGGFGGGGRGPSLAAADGGSAAAGGLPGAGVGGGFPGGLRPGGFGGGMPAGLGGGNFGGAGGGALGGLAGGAGPGPLAGGAGRGVAPGGADFSGLSGGGADGLRGGGLPGGGLPGRGGGAFGAAGAGGFAAGGGSLSAGRLNSFLGLPSDEGLHNLSGENSLGVQRPGFLDVNHGSVEGPRGGEAAGTTISGPGGRTVGRGVAVGPYGGATAGRFAEGPHGIVAGFAHVSPSGRYTTAAAVRGNFNNFNFYGGRWYTDHPGAWYAAGWASGYAWNAATWDSVGAWFGYADAAPVDYDYGQTVTYGDDAVMVNGQSAGTPQAYAQQATTLAAAGADADASSDDQWLPLGVFALARNESTSSTVTLQLAVDRQGVIRGNSTDDLSGQTQVIRGSVDKETQRVAFTVGDNSSTVVETGLYNLTKDEAPVLIHFGADRTEQWLLVRLKNPNDSADNSPTPQ